MATAMRLVPTLALVAAGCASDRGQYAFAPPLAPPVYSQPAGYATPVVTPASSIPATVPGPVVAQGSAVAAAPSDPCAGVVPAGVVVEAPCADAGLPMADGAIVTGMAVDDCCDGEVVVQ